MRNFDLDASAGQSENSLITKDTSARTDSSASPQRLAYSVREVAALTGLGRSTIYVLLGQKTLDSLRVGGRRLITHEAVIALLNREAI